MSVMTAGELLDLMAQTFQQEGIEAPEIEAVAMLAELRECNRVMARLDRDPVLDEALVKRGLEVLARRKSGEPWQYIFNRAYFRDLTLYVDKGVLIPRPETELLVDWCIKYLPEGGALLDVGTGSGAIALSVALERPDAQVTAVDISPEALAVVRRNIADCAPERVELLHSDLFSAVPGRRFDIIAANLPYVADDEYETLDVNVRNFEPRLALTSGADGLDLIRRSIVEAADHLTGRGAMIWELAPDQALPVAEMLAGDLRYSAVEIIKDYTQRDRFVAARLREAPVAFN